MTGRVVLTGPRSLDHPLAEILDAQGVSGPVAVITAGWQESEAEDVPLREELGREVVNLRLYERADRVWSADRDLRQAHQSLHVDLRLLQSMYRHRLSNAAESWLDHLEATGSDRIVSAEREAALGAIRELDRHHLSRMAEIRVEYETAVELAARPGVARERAELDELLDSVEAVVIEGGHVAVLLNRIRLFGLEDRLRERTVVGRSGGGMVLCEQVVLYHDAPAVGRGHAELGLVGLGIAPGLVALPDAGARLRLDEPARMRLLSARFARMRCVVLDAGAWVAWDGSSLSGTTPFVDPLGGITPMEDVA